MAVFLFAYAEIIGGVIISILTLYAALKWFAKDGNKIKVNEETVEPKKAKTEKHTQAVLPKTKKSNVKTKDPSYSHKWLLTTLKGHSGQILDLDFNSNGKYLASCGDDRQVMLWTVKTFSDKSNRWVRANIEFDHATRVKWSPDSKAFIVCVANENAIQVHKLLKKKEDGTLGNVDIIIRFPVKHNNDIINIGIACNGLFIMSCSSDTTMVIWSLKGEPLATIDTLHMNNYYGCVSPCGRFVASSGFTPDVRIWEVCFSKTGEFKEIKRAFELKGHTSGITHFAFSNDSSRMATISKDGTWKLWDTNIDYVRGQEPYLLQSCNISSATMSNSLIALSSDGRTVAVCLKSDISIYSAITGDLQASIKEVHSDSVSVMNFSPDGQYLVATAGRHIRVFRNLPGYKNVILGLEEGKKHATSATVRERLQQQIEEANLFRRLTINYLYLTTNVLISANYTLNRHIRKFIAPITKVSSFTGAVRF